MDLTALSDQELASLLAQTDQPQAAKPLEQMTDVELRNALIRAPKEDTVANRAQDLWDKPHSKGPSIIGFAKNIFSGATLPGDVLAGKVDPMSPESITRSVEFASIPVTGGMGLGVFGAPQGGIGSGMMRARAPRVEAPTPPVASAVDNVIQQAGELGVQIPKAIATESVPTQRVGMTLSNIPGIGNPLVEAKDKTLQQLGNAATGIQQKLGTGSERVAGEEALGGVTNWIKNDSQKPIQAAYKTVDDLVDKNVTTPLTNTAKAIEEINARRANAALSETPAGGMLKEALARTEGMNYNGLKDLRSIFGPNVSHDLVSKGIPQGESKTLYSALTKDLEASVLNAGGEQALSKWKEANSLTRLTKAQQNALTKIVGRDGANSPEAVFDKIFSFARTGARGDDRRLTLARKAMGDSAWGEVSAAVISRLGRDPSGEFSPQRFVTAWDKLSKDGKAHIFTNPDHLRDLEKINNVSKFLVKNYQRFGNPSGTAQNVNLTNIGMGALGMGVVGGVTGIIPAIALAVGGRITAEALAAPATTRAIAKFSVAAKNAAALPAPKTAQALEMETRSLANALSQLSGQDAATIFHKLQSVGPAGANNENQ